MKKYINLKYINILLIIIFTFILYSCNIVVNELSTPTITLNDNIVTWNKILNAEEYEIYLNGELKEMTKETEYKIESNEEVTIKIRAVKSKLNEQNEEEKVYSNFSNEIIYKITINNDSGVIIFEINDTHGAFETTDTPGIAKVATIIKSLEEYNTVVKIANGDIFQGGFVSNMTYGKCFIDVLNSLNFDCFVIGNHEFDWGLEKIAEYKDGDITNGEASFPFLAANIIDKRTNTRPDWLDEYTIVEKDNQKIGIIGLIGEGLTSSISTSKVENYTFSDPLPIIKRLVPTLRNKGCDFVIVSIHEYSNQTNNQISYLSENLLPDAVICGHTHQKISETLTTQTNYNLPIVQSNTKNLTVGSVKLSKTNNKLNQAIISHYYPNNYQEDEETLKIINNYKDLIDAGNENVGFTPTYLSKSELGYFACDAIQEGTNVDIAIMNTGGVRTTINPGYIKMQDIFEAFPFDNYIYIVEINGSQLKNFLNRNGEYLYWNQNFKIENIDTSKTYTLAIIDYVYFGTYYSYYFEPYTGISTNEIIRKYIIDALKETL